MGSFVAGHCAGFLGLVALGFAAGGMVPACAADGFFDRETLTSDWGGARSTLEDAGVAPSLSWTGEVLGNPSGGMEQGTVYEGLVELDLDLDMNKIAGWNGATIHASGYWIQGRGLSQYYVANLLTVSNIEAGDGFRLNELYLEQSLWSDSVNIRLGQLAADAEFFLSDTAGLFINSTFGWPGIFGVDLPINAPAYPLPTPGVRVRVAPDDNFQFQAGFYNGTPTGRYGDANGLEFPLGDGLFAIFEASYAYAPRNGLAGTWRVGGLYNSDDFDNLSIAQNGLSLADPAVRGGPREETGTYALYGMVDHALWQGADGQTVSAFVRGAIAPQADRNLITTYVDVGATVASPFVSRPNDIVGVAFAYANVSPDFADLNRQQNFFSGVNGPVSNYEAVVELSYQAVFSPWLSLQPFTQYVIHPGGNVANPDGSKPTEAMENAWVLGARMGVTF